MAYCDLVLKSTLPNLDVDFFEPSENIKLYVNLVYGSVGKLVKVDVSYSDDLLTSTSVLTFCDRAALDEYRNDPNVCAERARAIEYNTRFGITSTLSIEESTVQVL